MGAGSSSTITNDVISDISMKIASENSVSSIIMADSSQNLSIFGSGNQVTDINMSMDMAITNYCTNEAALDAKLASSLASTFVGSAKDQQVAVLGALNSSSQNVANMVSNSVAASVSSATAQKCLISMATKQGINIVGNDNIVSRVTMDSSRKATQQCMNKSSLDTNIAAQVQSWADEQTSSEQTGPIDGLFDALNTLAGAPAAIAMAIIAGGVLIFVVIIYMIFGGKSKSMPNIVYNSRQDALRQGAAGGGPDPQPATYSVVPADDAAKLYGMPVLHPGPNAANPEPSAGKFSVVPAGTTLHPAKWDEPQAASASDSSEPALAPSHRGDMSGRDMSESPTPK